MLAEAAAAGRIESPTRFRPFRYLLAAARLVFLRAIIRIRRILFSGRTQTYCPPPKFTVSESKSVRGAPALKCRTGTRFGKPVGAKLDT